MLNAFLARAQDLMAKAARREPHSVTQEELEAVSDLAIELFAPVKSESTRVYFRDLWISHDYHFCKKCRPPPTGVWKAEELQREVAKRWNETWATVRNARRRFKNASEEFLTFHEQQCPTKRPKPTQFRVLAWHDLLPWDLHIESTIAGQAEEWREHRAAK